MSRAGASALVALAVVSVAVDARADKLAVEVIEVAGEQAYVQPGEAAGLTIGAEIKLGKRSFKVVGVTRDAAAIALDGATLKVGARGVANVTPGATVVVEQRPTPAGLDTYRAQWPTAARPADAQTPTPVPLGSGRPPGALQFTGWASGLGVVAGQRDTLVAGEIGARASYQPWRERPLAADVDVAARLSSAGRGGARTPLQVRAAQLRWGSADDPRVAIGRLRWASTSTGMLDGARVAARFGTVELAGFGGLVPDAATGGVEPSATRFGAELVYDDARGAWQPRVAVEVHGSTWNGAVDERRLAIDAEAHHGNLTLDSYAEAQAFAADNPWGAKAVELVGAGAGLRWRRRGSHAGLDASIARPERSLRLDAALPADWLCVREPGVAGADEACQGGDLWADATVSAGLLRPRWSVDAGLSAGTTHGDGVSTDASAFALGSLRVLPMGGRLELGAAGGRAAFLDWAAGDVGVVLAPTRRLGAALRYRAERRVYTGALQPLLAHALLGDVRWAHGPTLDVAVTAGVITGDLDALTLLTTVSWRPLR